MNKHIVGYGAALALLLVGTCRLHVTAERYEDAAFRADSLQAVNDTTRVVAQTDSATYWERRAVQLEHVADSLSDALGQRAVTTARATVQVDSVEVFVEATQPVPTLARFQFYRMPYHVDAAVRLDTTPPQARFRIGLDPIVLQARVTCAETERPVRPAQVGLSGPPWAQLTLRDVYQDRDVCNPPSVIQPSISASLIRGDWAWPVIGALAGAAAAVVFNEELPIGAVVGGAVGLGFTLAF